MNRETELRCVGPRGSKYLHLAPERLVLLSVPDLLLRVTKKQRLEEKTGRAFCCPSAAVDPFYQTPTRDTRADTNKTSTDMSLNF